MPEGFDHRELFGAALEALGNEAELACHLICTGVSDMYKNDEMLKKVRTTPVLFRLLAQETMLMWINAYEHFYWKMEMICSFLNSLIPENSKHGKSNQKECVLDEEKQIMFSKIVFEGDSSTELFHFQGFNPVRTHTERIRIVPPPESSEKTRDAISAYKMLVSQEHAEKRNAEEADIKLENACLEKVGEEEDIPPSRKLHEFEEDVEASGFAPRCQTPMLSQLSGAEMVIPCLEENFQSLDII